MNETLQTIAKRYSCRAYTDQVPDDGAIEAIATAGLQAPSGMNKQPWHLVVVTDKALIADMEAEGMRIIKAMEDQSTYERIMGRGGKLYYNAPVMIFTAIDGGAGSELDCGIVTQNMALAATAQGLGSVICGLAAIALSGPKKDDFVSRLGFPEGYRFGSAILIGYPAKQTDPHEPDRAKLSWVR